jgi:hypothetical protein
LPVSGGRPPKLPVSGNGNNSDTGKLPVSDTGNTGKSEVVDTGNLEDSLLVTLANKVIGNEWFDPSEWRIEVYTNRNGRRYWNHRRRGKRGGKDNWKFGGKFDELSHERQEQYWQRAKSKG